MQRATLWLALSVAVVVAGCGSLTGTGGMETETPSLTPVVVPETERSPAPELVAPGLTADRLVDYTALVGAHAAILEGTSHTYREQVTRRYTNGTVRRQHLTVIQRNGSAARYQYNRSATVHNPTPRSVERWTTGDRLYVARTDGNETTISVAEVPPRRQAIPLRTVAYAMSLSRVFPVFDIVVVDTERRDGRTLYRLSTPDPGRVSSVRNITFVGYVTPDGVFTQYRLTYQIIRDPAVIDVTVQVSFEEIGSTSVQRPAWTVQQRNTTNDGAPGRARAD